MGAPERRNSKENNLKDLVKKLNDLDTGNAEAVMAIPWSFKYPEFLSEGERIARVLGDEKGLLVFSVMRKKKLSRKSLMNWRRRL